MVTETKPALDTATLKGVEVLAVGRWNGDQYNQSDLNHMADAFHQLKGRIDPPGKLGHDGEQELAQRDGYPAIGWVTSLYVKGKKLLADFDKVPRKVADLITAGAYNKVSSEVYFDREIDGKTYPRVLKAVAFLGADAPAVKDIKSISDVADLYRDRFPLTEAHYADYAVKGTDANSDPDNDGDDDRTDDPKKNPDADEDAKLDDEDTMMADFDDYCQKLEDRIKGNSGAKKLRTFLSTTRQHLAGMKLNPQAPKENTDMDTKVLAEALGLPATATEAEILAAVSEKKTATLTDNEVRKLREEVTTLKTERVSELAEAAVDGAIRAGKFAPPVREDLVKMAVADLDGFKAYAERTPRMPIFKVYGHEEDVDASEGKPTETDVALSKQLGVSAASLERAKSGRPSAELADEYRRERQKVTA